MPIALATSGFHLSIVSKNRYTLLYVFNDYSHNSRYNEVLGTVVSLRYKRSSILKEFNFVVTGVHYTRISL